MLRIQGDLTQEILDEFFLSDPALCYQGLADHELAYLYANKHYMTNSNMGYLGAYLNDDLVLVLCYSAFSDICINIHPYLKTIYQHTEMFGDIQDILRKYFIENTQVKKIISMSPSPCKHIIKTCERYGFKYEGMIKQSTTWRQEIVDVIIYGLDVK